MPFRWSAPVDRCRFKGPFRGALRWFKAAAASRKLDALPTQIHPSCDRVITTVQAAVMMPGIWIHIGGWRGFGFSFMCAPC